MKKLKVTEYKDIRVLTTKQLAAVYGTDEKIISYNFRYNEKRYTQGKHYIVLTGKELKDFKTALENQEQSACESESNPGIQETESSTLSTNREFQEFLINALSTNREFQEQSKHTGKMYLWTEKGALLHAKSINTDKAWEVYDYLVDFYYRPGARERTEVVPAEKPAEAAVQKKQIPEIVNPISAIGTLLRVAENNGYDVCSYPFRHVNGCLYGDTIGIRTDLTVEKACHELAWELSHAFIHYRAGDIIKSPLAGDYNDQADRAAELIIKVLNTKELQGSCRGERVGNMRAVIDFMSNP